MDSIKKEHLISAIEEIKNNPSLVRGRASNSWDLIYDGQIYPPKLVIGIANRYATGKELGPHDFLGGDNQPSFKMLRDFGFELVSKKNPIAALLQKYKAHILASELKDEKYKWELLSRFGNRPDTEAADFLQEVKSIKYGNLVYNLAPAVLNQLVANRPEEMRGLFRALFDETTNLSDRFKSFSDNSLNLYRNIGGTRSHHQDERTIAAYLTFKYPNKYTFYKSSFYKKLCQLLKVPEAAKYEKYPHYLKLVNTLIEDHISKDAELIAAAKKFIPDYYGLNHLLLAQDFLYQMLDKEQSHQRRYWLYAPGENARKWDEFYNEGIMGLGWDYLGDLNDYDSKDAIASKLRELENADGSKNNDAMANFDFKESIALGDIIITKRGRREYVGYGIVTSDYYYDESRDNYQKCRKVDWKKKGVWTEDGSDIVLKTLTDITKYPQYVEKLIDLIGIETMEKVQQKESGYRTPLNQILYGPPGTGKTYSTKEAAVKIANPTFNVSIAGNLTVPQRRKAVTDEYEKLLENGQIVFCTFHQSMSYEDFVEGIKPETIGDDISYSVQPGVFKELCERAGVNSNSNFEDVVELFKADVIANEPIKINTGRSKFDVFYRGGLTFKINPEESEKENPHYSASIENMRKFYQTNSLKGIYNPSYVSGIVNYLYEKYGLVRYNAVADSPDKNYVLIIDEINRGNVSAIFGELITLLEADKRIGQPEEVLATLPYSKDSFGVPPNLYIIGTMNTADRSVEALDTALRRRFSFKEILPEPELLKDIEFNGFNLAEVLTVINQRIEALLDRDHTIGHSYFINIASHDVAALANAFRNCILPLLQEYFYGDYEKIALVLGKGFVRKKPMTQFSFAAFDDLEVPEPRAQFELIQDIEEIEEAVRLLLNRYGS